MGKNIVLKNSLGEDVLYENVSAIRLNDGTNDGLKIQIDEDLEPNPTWWDIENILKNDTRNYGYKIIYLFPNLTLKEENLNLGGQAYETSDGAFYESSTLTHTWDLSKDKPCYIDGVEQYKTRYIIVYSNSRITPKRAMNFLWYYGIKESGTLLANVSFANCCYLELLPKDLDTSARDNFYQYFQSCEKLKGISSADFSSATSFMNAFTRCYQLKKNPQIDYSKSYSFSNAFDYCYNLEVVENLNCSSCSSMSSTFQYCYNLRTVCLSNTSNVTNFSSIFYNCGALETIKGLDLYSATSAKNLFSNCSSLTFLDVKNIRVDFKIGEASSSSTNCRRLSAESIINAIRELWDYSDDSSAHTLTLGPANTDKISEVYVRLISPTEEQIANDPYIESKIPVELCKSTDDGAMQILDYATSKGWTIV